MVTLIEWAEHPVFDTGYVIVEVEATEHDISLDLETPYISEEDLVEWYGLYADCYHQIIIEFKKDPVLWHGFSMN